jgi:hypothetical protein
MKRKQEPPCFNVITKASLDQFPECCGIGVLMNFQDRKSASVDHYDYTTWPYTPIFGQPRTKEDALTSLGNEKLVLATTIPYQKDAIQALKAVGFKKILTTPSKEGRYVITLWAWKRPPVRRKKNVIQ